MTNNLEKRLLLNTIITIAAIITLYICLYQNFVLSQFLQYVKNIHVTIIAKSSIYSNLLFLSLSCLSYFHETSLYDFLEEILISIFP